MSAAKFMEVPGGNSLYQVGFRSLWRCNKGLWNVGCFVGVVAGLDNFGSVSEGSKLRCRIAPVHEGPQKTNHFVVVSRRLVAHGCGNFRMTKQLQVASELLGVANLRTSSGEFDNEGLV